MRVLVILLCLCSTTAGAWGAAHAWRQTAPAAPPDEPEWARFPTSAPPVESTPQSAERIKRAESAERTERYSRFSAGAGGPAVAVTEILTGLAGGAVLGSAYDVEGQTSNLYTGAMIGGLTLGTTGILYQYFYRVERSSSLFATLTSLAWMTGGIGFANNRHLGDKKRAFIALGFSQLGLFGSLLLTSRGLELSGADLGLISISAAYAVAIASLIELVNDARNSTRGYNFAPMLMAPAIGMAVGGLLSVPLELNGVAFALITTIPPVASGMALALSAPLSSRATTGRVVLLTLSGSLGLTALITALTSLAAPRERTSASTLQLTPTPVVLAAGRHNTALAVGPGVSIQF